MDQDDLGFVFRIVKSGNVLIHHHRKLAATLRGARAKSFIAQIETSSFVEQQELMARITGNYKRGNEKLSKEHPRNSD